jgi:hypothetical protein
MMAGGACAVMILLGLWWVTEASRRGEFRTEQDANTAFAMVFLIPIALFGVIELKAAQAIARMLTLGCLGFIVTFQWCCVRVGRLTWYRLQCIPEPEPTLFGLFLLMASFAMTTWIFFSAFDPTCFVPLDTAKVAMFKEYSFAEVTAVGDQVQSTSAISLKHALYSLIPVSAVVMPVIEPLRIRAAESLGFR